MSNMPRLWPYHPKPQQGELFSSWLLRTAHGNSEKPHTFCHIVWPHKQIWNRDIDLMAGNEMLQTMVARTATSWESAADTLLSAYVGSVLQAVTPDRKMRWVMPLGIYHRTRRRFGLQWCPSCLSEDKVPYFRRSWRMAFSTSCRLHQCLLVDACHLCGAPAVPHKGEHMKCHSCGTAYNEAPSASISAASAKFGLALVTRSQGAITTLDGVTSVHPIIYFDIVRQLIRVFLSDRRGEELEHQICSRFPIESEPLIEREQAIAFEALRVNERHAVLEHVGYLLDNWPDQLVTCCRESRNWRSWLLSDMRPARYPLWDIAVRNLNAKHMFSSTYS